MCSCLYNELYNLLAWAIGGMTAEFDFFAKEPARVMTNVQVHKAVMSIGQEIVYAMHHGRIKTHKHIALPMTVWHLTGSSQIVSLLNKFGHGISYSQLEELDTALAESALAGSTQLSYLPPDIDSRLPAIFCFDNNAINEQTLVLATVLMVS